jgi:hypothetical protein
MSELKKLYCKVGNFSRQGDVKVKMIASVPEGSQTYAKENGEAVLAHGEVTCHKHKITEGEVRFFTVGDSQNMFSPKYLEVVSDSAVLWHDEHISHVLDKGVYEVTIQREYFPEEIRNVRD